MNQIEIFDPAMCCSMGVFGPSVDLELVRMSADVESLKNKESKSKDLYLTTVELTEWVGVSIGSIGVGNKPLKILRLAIQIKAVATQAADVVEIGYG
jgi:hypothetical protein